MPESHHSIGEVLSLLKDDHPDITISKIRFLESQGLIEPERTPSGYRKFYDGDIERLRWILAQQRDNFLPLKVIKRRLQDAGFEPIIVRDDDSTPVPEPTLFAARRSDDAVSGGEDSTEPSERSDHESVPANDGATAGSQPEPQPQAQSKSQSQPRGVAGSVSLTATELAAAANVDAQLLTDLLKLGMIEGTDVGGDIVFDHEALIVARAAAGFAERGMEARHLRMFKVSAEREAGVFEQLVAPLRRQAADGHDPAAAELTELVGMAETIRRSLLRRALGLPID